MRDLKRGSVIVAVVIILAVMAGSFASAGVLDWLKGAITGKATEKMQMNITIGVPQIIDVLNSSISASTMNEGPSTTSITFNFSVFSPTGSGSLRNVSAVANVSKAGETTRQNLSCSPLEFAGNYANFTCTIKLLWWDINGAWTIIASINDSSNNQVVNTTTTFTAGSTTGFSLGPGNITWPGMASGAINQTPTSGAVLLNNTGNQDIAVGKILFNATHLRGETTTTQAIWAGNMSASWDSTNTNECDINIATALNKTGGLWAGIPTANLTAGNYTANDLVIGQEEVSLCILQVGADLSTQQYSTAVDGAWTIQIS